MEVEQQIIALFKRDSIRNNIRIHFPNGERPDICNDHIESESVKLSDSVCSGSTLKFGICEAAKFECTVNNIEEKYIIDETGTVQLNPTPFRGNIKGLKIEVTQEVDISSLPEDFITEYGQTADDVPYPFYPVPLGAYIVDSCKKQSNMDKRQITAYDMLKSYILDSSCMPWLEHIYSDFAVSADLYEQPTCLKHARKLQYCLYSVLAYRGISVNNLLERLDNGILLVKEDLTTDLYPNGDRIPYIFTEEKKSSTGVVLGQPLQLNQSFVYGIHTYTNEINYSGKFMVAVTYNMAAVSDYNKNVNRINGTALTDEERLQEIQNTLYITVPYTNGEQTGKFHILPNTVVDCSELGAINGAIDVHSRVIFARAHPRYIGSGFWYSVEAAYNIVESVSVLRIEDVATASNLDFRIVYYPENRSTNVDAQKLTYRNIISSILELKGLFGNIDTGGRFSKRKLGGNYYRLLCDRILEDKHMLNCSEECMIPESEEISVWYDLDEKIERYGKVTVKGTGSNDELTTFTFSDGAKKYIFEGNILMESGLYTVPEMYEICKNLHMKLQSIKIVPLTASIKGIPLRKAGEYVLFNDDGYYVGSYIMSKTTEGNHSLIDEIDSTNISN